MATMSHEPPAHVSGRSWLELFRISELLPTLAIVVIWLAVLFVGIFGPDFVGNSNDGSSATIPSGIGVAFFALFATISVAKYGYKRK